MKENHPSEMNLQEYAANKSFCSALLAAHIESCSVCLEEVNTYEALFFEIKKKAPLVFDFDLSALVVSQLPKCKTGISTDHFIAGFLILFIGSLIAAPMYLFRTYILNMFSGISAFFVYAIIGSVSSIIIYKSIELYKNYQKQMRALNLI